MPRITTMYFGRRRARERSRRDRDEPKLAGVRLVRQRGKLLESGSTLFPRETARICRESGPRIFGRFLSDVSIHRDALGADLRSCGAGLGDRGPLPSPAFEHPIKATQRAPRPATTITSP